jgi:hypothetical protein
MAGVDARPDGGEPVLVFPGDARDVPGTVEQRLIALRARAAVPGGIAGQRLVFGLLALQL